jgi:hypothetical protein
LKTWLRAFATSGALVMVMVIVIVIVMVMVMTMLMMMMMMMMLQCKRRLLSAHHHQTYMHT